MSPIRLGLARASTRRPLLTRPPRALQRRWDSSQPTASGQQSEKPNLHRNFYYTFGSPLLKVFLGALFTYELLLTGWLKLEEVELKHDKNDEIQKLEHELATATATATKR